LFLWAFSRTTQERPLPFVRIHLAVLTESEETLDLVDNPFWQSSRNKWWVGKES